MEFRVALEWSGTSGLSLKELYPIQHGFELAFKKRNYGRGISRIGVVISCLESEVGSQRKKFQKATQIFTYDIILDYLLIVATESKDEKKRIIKRQVVEVSEQTFSKYKFEGFDKEAFLHDLKETINSIEW